MATLEITAIIEKYGNPPSIVENKELEMNNLPALQGFVVDDLSDMFRPNKAESYSGTLRGKKIYILAVENENGVDYSLWMNYAVRFTNKTQSYTLRWIENNLE